MFKIGEKSNTATNVILLDHHHYLSIAETVDECNKKALKHKTFILKCIITMERYCYIVIFIHLNSG